MENRTLYVQEQDDFPEELEPDILDIISPSQHNPSFKPDLADNQKRWLIIGFCLHNIITPELRTYSEPFVESLYHNYKKLRIDNQTLRTHISGHNHVTFNYEAINNNKVFPRILGRKDEKKYNFNVTNHVEFSKLFLATNMANYTVFDSSIDLSVLLGLIKDIDSFPQIVRTIAEKLRTKVRNVWAHCNFDEWDSTQYQESFQLMFQIIKYLSLNQTQESELNDELTKWEKNGFKFLQGYVISQEVTREIMRNTDILVEYSRQMKSGVDSNFKKVNSSLVCIKGELEITFKSIEEIKCLQLHNEEVLHVLGERVDTTQVAITEIGHIQEDQGQQLKKTHSAINTVADKVKDMNKESNTTTKRVISLESRAGQADKKIESLKSGLIDLQSYMSHSRPAGKLFFTHLIGQKILLLGKRS